MYLKNKHFLAWLPLAGALVGAPACSVDLNEEPYGTDEDVMPECDPAMRSRIRILQGARTRTLAPPAKPTVPQTVSLSRPDPADAAKLVAVANLRFNATTSVTLCPGQVKITVTSQTVVGDQIEPIDLGEFDVDIAAMKRYSLVVTGNVAPAEGKDGINLVVIDESAIPAPVGNASNVVLVNALHDSPTISVDTNAADGAEVAALPRYGVSELVPVTPGETKITLLEGETAAASFTIDPFPAGANLIAILYDQIALNMDGDPQARLFLTGSDPLIGNAPGNGIKILAD